MVAIASRSGLGTPRASQMDRTALATRSSCASGDSPMVRAAMRRTPGGGAAEGLETVAAGVGASDALDRP